MPHSENLLEYLQPAQLEAEMKMIAESTGLGLGRTVSNNTAENSKLIAANLLRQMTKRRCQSHSDHWL